MEASSSVETKSAVNDVEPKPEKIEDLHEEGPSFHCDLCDRELAYKIAQDLLSGLATACVDSTTGAIFTSPASVAANIRKEMVDYLTVRSESFVAESVVLEAHPDAEMSEHPCDILSNMIDDFAVLKRNLWSRVSGWVLSETREDKIDDFVQGLERDKFWLLDRREDVAQTLIKNVDFKNLYHCNMKLCSEEEVKEHHEKCGFRTVMCGNEGCYETVSANSLERHDSACPFKILPCEQKCSERLMRRDMDRHCITVCPMKLANCPFYSIGCISPIPQCLIKKHCTENTHGHLLNVIQFIHKEASTEDAEHWAEQIERSQFADQLEARDVRTLTRIVKDIEKRIGPFEVVKKKTETVEEAAAPPPEQPTTAPPEVATTAAPPADHAAYSPVKERDAPSLSPKQDAASSPATTLPEQAVTTTQQKEIKTPPPPGKGATSPGPAPAMAEQQVVTTITTPEAMTVPPVEKGMISPPPTPIPPEKAVTKLEVHMTALLPQLTAISSSHQDEAVPSPVQAKTSPSNDQAEAAPSLEQAKTMPPQQTPTSPANDHAEAALSPEKAKTGPPQQPES